MKIQHGLTSLAKGLLVVFVLLGTTRCGSGTGGSLQMASTVPYSGSNYLSQASCGQGLLQGVLIMNPAGNIAVGTTATWQVSAGGCANMVFTPIGLSPIQLINGTATYQRNYPTAASMIEETGTLTASNSVGQVVASITVSSSPFSVGSGSTGSLPCNAIAAQSVLIAPVDQNGNPLAAPPSDGFTVSSNRPISILSVTNMNGSIIPAVNPAQLPPAVSQSFQAEIPAIGVDQIVFQIADASNPANQAACAVEVTVQTQAGQSGIAPTCTLTVAQSGFALNSQMVLTLSVFGGPASAMELTLGNQTASPVIGQAPVLGQSVVPVIGPNTFTAPSVSGSYTATVTLLGPSGTPVNECGVNFVVGTPSSTSLNCQSSSSSQETVCPINGTIVTVDLDKQLSCSKSCVQGTSWGVDVVNNQIWVTDSCKAKFDVTYLK